MRSVSPPSSRSAPRAAALFSVVVLASRDERTLGECLEAVARALGGRAAEVLVVMHGGAEGGVLSALAALRPRLPGLRALRVSPGTLGRARNLALGAAGGEVVVFLDDDAAPLPGFFLALERALAQYPEADVLGGPNLTFPDSSFFERLVGCVLSSPFGAGSMSLRYRGYPRDTWTDERALMLCNLCVRRRALQGENLEFDEEVTRNEENLLLERLRLRGRLLLHSPDLAVHHRRRRSVGAFARQCLLSGVGRAQMTRRLPESLRVEHLGPATLLAALVAWPLGAPLAWPLGGYAAACAAAAAAGAAETGGGLRAWLCLAVLFPLGHLSYAAGFVRGLFSPRRRSP